MKLLSLGNKVEKAKALNDEDDEDSEEKKKLVALTRSFNEQSDIVMQLFNFVRELCVFEEDSTRVIIEYPELSQMLQRGMILSEN